MKFADFISINAIRADLTSDDKESVIAELVQALLDAGEIDPAEKEDIVAAILKREELGSTGAYPGAQNIPLGVLPARLGELDKSKPVVVYCAAGGRSAQAAVIMQAAGFTEVVNGGGLSQMPR